MISQPDQPAVLVVDDEALIRMMLTDELEDVGCAAFEAGNATEALAMLEAHPEVSVLFTDINMPGVMNGIELARKVMSVRPEIRLFIASGRERPVDSSIPADAHFVEKPYNPGRIAQLICEPA
jgi:CheY-like chemotaxis protein